MNNSVIKIRIKRAGKLYIYAKYGHNYYCYEHRGRVSIRHIITAQRFLAAQSASNA